jgi:ribosomal protein S16
MIFGTFLAQGIFNFIIAIFLHTFRKVNEDKEIYEIRSMLLDIRDVDMFLGRFYQHGWINRVKSYYLFIVPVPKDGKVIEKIGRFDKAQGLIQNVGLELIESKIEEKFKDRKNDISTVINNLEKKKKEKGDKKSDNQGKDEKSDDESKSPAVGDGTTKATKEKIEDAIPAKGSKVLIEICSRWDKEGSNKTAETLKLIQAMADSTGKKSIRYLELWSLMKSSMHLLLSKH